jgi:uncharacterized repeat protein (TIGR01451 family)
MGKKGKRRIDMKSISNKIKGVLQLASLALAVSMVVAMPQFASANTGANATILNVVQVNYKDASGVTAYAETAASTVTVNLVQSAPTVSAPANAAVASGGTATYTYTVTATANGSDVYPVAATAGTTTNATGVTVTPSVASLTLGASVITAVPAINQVIVPAGSQTNLIVGDVVVVNGNSYLISAVGGADGVNPISAATHTNVSGTDGTAGTTSPENAALITLAINPAGSNVAPNFTVDVPGTPSPLVGTVVGEQQSFTVAVTGTAGPGAGNGTIPVNTSVGTGPGAITTNPTVTTLNGAALTITKEVSTDGGATFGPTGAGAPGSTLTYRITVTNAGAGNATAVVVTDPMPLYTTYTAGTAKSGTVIGATYVAAATALTDASDAPIDQYDFGITAANQATLSIGTLAAGATTVLYYQVIIN